MKVLSIVFLVSGINDITKLGYEEGDLVFLVVGEIFALCLFLFLTWRIYASKSTTDENTEGSLNGQDDEDEDDDNRGLPKDFWKL